MIDQKFVGLLKSTKNLLAFSAGVDSSALFFLLYDNQIPFDIALVNYGTRECSDIEEAHAISLAEQYHKKSYTVKAPHFRSNFEAQARAFRYRYFEDVIAEEGYDVLLTAHQLNDRLEWFLMRFVKGAGITGLSGMEAIQQKAYYTLVRPLLDVPKSELKAYLDMHHYPYFIDESNQNDHYERNRFRKQYADSLVECFAEGIKRSFEYLDRDSQRIEAQYTLLYAKEKFRVIKLFLPEIKVLAADKTLKKLGYLLSASQRAEIDKENSVVIGGEWALERHDDLLYIAPYIQCTMPKSFKEMCRLARVPAKVRGYCFEAGIDISEVAAIKQKS